MLELDWDFTISGYDEALVNKQLPCAENFRVALKKFVLLDNDYVSVPLLDYDCD